MYKFYALCLLLLLASSAHAKLYQWTDEQGNVHFTDSPPLNVDAQEREIKSGKPRTDSVQRLHAEREARVKAKEAAARAAVVSEQEAKNNEVRQKNCDIAKERLRFYTEDAVSRRIRVKQEDGTYYWKTPEDIAKDTKDARKLVAEWCNPPKPPQPDVSLP